MKAITLLLLGIVCVSVLVVTYSLPRPTIDPQIRLMETWLDEEQLVPSIGLYREDPNAALTTMWLANDFISLMKVASYPLSTITFEDTILASYPNMLSTLMRTCRSGT